MKKKNSNKYSICGISTDWGRPGCQGKYGGVGWYRIINPLEKLGAEVIKTKFWLNGIKTALELKSKGNIWVTKPMDSPDVVMELFVDRDFAGTKIVLDLDDDPFNINPSHPGYQSFKDKENIYKMFIRSADHLICSTEYIKNVVKDINPKITVIPNAIDPAIWKVKRKKRTDGKIRIGWFGSSSHISEIDILHSFMEEILVKYPQVEFHLAGFSYENINDGDKKENARVFHYAPTKGYKEYPQFVADKDLDIAIAPLHDNQFNRCKSNIKFLEHSMLETPMVLSDVTPYKEVVDNYKTGYLAKNKNQWVKYLSWLIESEEKRKEIGKAAKKAVEKDWLIEKQLPKYEKLLEKLTEREITVYTANIGGFDKLEDCQEDLTANYVAYTDQKSDTWDCKKSYDKFKDDRRNSRIQKIMPHLFIDTKYSIYLDGNIRLTVPAQKLIDEYLKDKDVAVIRHIGRDCIYQEADACIQLKKGKPEDLAEQVKAYAKIGWKEHAGLAECGVIIRRHTKEVEQWNEKWWAHYCRYSERDQISFPLAFPLEKVNLIEQSYWRHLYLNNSKHLKI
jgi:glycosyltransferase involved in cell wall biosynthesis